MVLANAQVWNSSQKIQGIFSYFVLLMVENANIPWALFTMCAEFGGKAMQGDSDGWAAFVIYPRVELVMERPVI